MIAIRLKITKLVFFATIFIISFFVGADAQTGTATVYLDSTQQIIRGFGAANIIGWRPDMTTDEVHTAFDTGAGQLGFTILRLRISPNENEFNIQVSTTKLAASLGAIIIASPWTPPASMKSNNSTIGGILNESSYAAYAAHLKAFVDYMSNNGIDIYAVSVQNEPDAVVTYESCSWDGTQMLNFMKNNASSIGTKVFMPESENFKHSLSDPTLNDSAAAANVAFIGGHIYGGGLTSYPLAVQKGKELWMTEHLDTDTTWNNVLATGKEINDCMNAGMSAYVWWYIVRFYGPIDENGNVTKRGYIMSQYSKFIRPGYVKVGVTENPQTNVYVTAYKSGTKLVIVAINKGSSSIDQTFSVQNGPFTKFTPYVTSQSKNCMQGNDINVSSNRFTATLDKSSVTTFVSDEVILPIEIISFSANTVDNKVNLYWSTASETNNAGFEIQRSTDGENFVKTGYIEGKGTTTERQNYTFVDKVTSDKLYYRLKQIDFDGSFRYSKSIEITASPLKFALLQNYPNPFNPTTQIRYSVPENSYMSLKVYNSLGQEVATLFEGTQQAGNHAVSFNGSELAGGIYFYQLKSNNFIETKKFVLLK